jgi:hypothetical protein
VRIYNPNMKKLDPRTTSGHFIGYAVNSKGFRFYSPSHSTRIVESMNAKFLEDVEPSGSAYPQRIELVKARELAKSPPHRGRMIVFRENQIDYLEPQSVLEQPTHEEQGNQFDPPEPQPIHTEQVQTDSTLPLQNAEEVELRKSSRIRRPAISTDYVVYLQEFDFDVGPKDDPSVFSQAMSGDNSTLWYDAMKEEMESMAKNQVWDLIDLPKGDVAIGCKWVIRLE